MKQSSFHLCAVVLALAAAPAWCQAPLKVGDVVGYRAESPHPYPPGRADRPVVWTDRAVSTGATFIRLHFRAFHLAPGDYVTVRNSSGSQVWTYTDRGPNGNGEFWSFAVTGDTAIVEIHGGARPEHGYQVDEVGHGTVYLGGRGPTPEVLCGTDGKEDVACHTEAGMVQRPVARLLFVSGRNQYLCTGWLASGSNANTMVTNNHCFSTQREVNTVQAMFNFQRTACNGTTNAPTHSFAGAVFLKTNSVNKRGKTGGLDYTLFTLRENPEGTWGELIATTKGVNVNDRIWFIQHPGGNEKKIGYFEDSAHTVFCKVDAKDQTYSGTAASSQVAYGCDSEGGSSGSPIIDPATGRVIALHHFGGVDNNSCLNSGTAMAMICADAGSLLSCVN